MVRYATIVIGILTLSSCAPGPGENIEKNTVAQTESVDARLRVATTTSLYDTGLWNVLEPLFEEKYGMELDVLYAGTGKALEWGERGDVDVLTIHDRSREETFVERGLGLERIPFAYNHFLIVGPPDDPAGIGGLSPEEAFTRLHGMAGPVFVSRGDDSGTHSREKSIWISAGLDYDDVRTSGDWYVEGGNGMGPTLVMADQMRAYTLSDVGTFLSYGNDLDLVPLVDSGNALLNVYSAIIVSGTDNMDGAEALVEFLLSDEVQELLGRYGVDEYGTSLFHPCGGEEPDQP